MSERVLSGTIRADGSILQGRGFQVMRKAAGQYLIIFQPPLSSVRDATVRAVSGTTEMQAAVRSVDGLHAAVTIDGPAGTSIDCDFSFVFSGHAHAGSNSAAPGYADLAGVVADPVIGSPSSLRPVVSFPSVERSAAPSPPDSGTDRPVSSDPIVAAQQAEINRLRVLMEKVLQPLQAENKMLRSKLDLLKRGTEPYVPPAGDRLPLADGLPAATLLAKLINSFEFETVLDFGPGWQQRCASLLRAEKVTSTLLDANDNVDPFPGQPVIRRGSIHTALLPTTFDCIIAAHVLHRERDPQRFLGRLHDLLPERAILALTVPALRYPMLHGELSIWSPGLVLYHLVLAGFNCSEARVLMQDEEISVIVEKDSIEAWENGTPLPPLASLRRHFPSRVDFVLDPACVNGDIRNLDW